MIIKLNIRNQFQILGREEFLRNIIFGNGSTVSPAKITNKYQMFLNTNIKIKVDENKTIDGQFIGINDDGSLMLIKDYKKLSIYSGQILL